MNKKNLKILIIIVLIIIIAVILFFVSKPKVSGVVQEQKEVSPYLNSKIETKIFQRNDDLWAYDILIDGNIYVHQPNIPAIGGNKGFETEQDAQKTAELVVNKIRNNILPPSITPEELKNLGIE